MTPKFRKIRMSLPKKRPKVVTTNIKGPKLSEIF